MRAFPVLVLALVVLSQHAVAAKDSYAQHVQKLQKVLPLGEFTIVVEPPFVVLGNESKAQVQRYSTDIVRWAVDRLKQDYFTKDPTDILEIWLLKDAKSYTKYARKLCGSDPTTPYGFFSAEHKVLVMDISTGGGTLVHEIVHPFVHSNFPDCPPWFNEGLGSLYEQSGEKDGHIVGYPNWRLPGLQQAIRSKRLGTFKSLTDQDEATFYRDDRATNYGQSRYLCYYLQEHGLLVRFYHEFLNHRKSDPTGYATLQTVLGESDMAAFQQRWEAFVLGLKYP